ncbi:MAG: helix-turn-helix domain-containing protein [Thermomicrobiales bacterium]
MAMFGDTLRQARTYKRVTLKDAERATRINRHHLAALEDENFGALPPLIYQRGIVRNYAAYLDLDAHKLVSLFEKAHGTTGSNDVVMAVKPLDMPSHWAPNFAIIAFMVVMGAVVFAWFYSAFFATGEALPTPTVVSTPTQISLAIAPKPIVTPDREPTATPDSAAAEASPTAETPDDASDSRRPRPTRAASESAAEPNARETPRPNQEPTKPPTSTPTPDFEATGAAESTTAAAASEEARVAGSTATAFAQSAIPITLSARDVTIGWLTVVADGAVVYDGTLAAGESTEQFLAQSYSIYTSDVGNTWIANASTGQTFVMPGSGQTTFSLP